MALIGKTEFPYYLIIDIRTIEFKKKKKKGSKSSLNNHFGYAVGLD